MISRHALYIRRQAVAQLIRHEREVANNVIISLTSFPERLGQLHLCIHALLQQTLKAEKIILFLSKAEMKNKSVPKALLSLQSDKFEIAITAENYRSYNKLVHALRVFPEKSIITVDDDFLYPPNMVSDLVEASKAYPGRTVNGGALLMLPKNGDEFEDIHAWPIARRICGPQVFGEGYASILYPPRCLSDDTTRDDLFMTMAPTTDDIWFKIMQVLNGTSALALGHIIGKKRRFLEYSAAPTLSSANRNGENNVSLKRAMRHYDLQPSDFFYAHKIAL